jgi:hypothetical protein
VYCWLAVRREEEPYLARTCLVEDLGLLAELRPWREGSLPIPGGGPMPGGVPLWPGKAPNPGGRPNGDAVLVSKLKIKVKLQGRGVTHLHKDCTPSWQLDAFEDGTKRCISSYRQLQRQVISRPSGDVVGASRC